MERFITYFACVWLFLFAMQLGYWVAQWLSNRDEEVAKEESQKNKKQQNSVISFRRWGWVTWALFISLCCFVSYEIGTTHGKTYRTIIEIKDGVRRTVMNEVPWEEMPKLRLRKD